METDILNIFKAMFLFPIPTNLFQMGDFCLFFCLKETSICQMDYVYMEIEFLQLQAV